MIGAVGVLGSGSNLITAEVYTYPVWNSDGEMILAPRLIDAASGSLYIGYESAMAWITTKEMTEGDAISLWWIIFNKPDNCAQNPCNNDDLFNDDVVPSMVGDAGTVVMNPDRVKFYSHLDIGDAFNAAFGPGLVNPSEAEIHIILRTHGPARAEILEEQLTTYMGGCGPNPPHWPCSEIQFAIFQQ